MGENHELKIRKTLINGIESAKNSIRLAVAYFSDMEIADLIKKRAGDGLVVEVVIYDHPVNSPTILEFNSKNINMHFYDINNSNPIYPKFCIIDEEILVTGNHGWAYAANRTEHPDPVIVNNESRLIEEYLNKFRFFKKNCGSSRFVHFKTKPEILVRYQ
ncbi:MAG: DnaJ domain protein [Parcubacteria group bacterium GW2011_GWF2_38_76]|nr:MAG: DnaJ domain protein [Parcubacteria group bacterium GW2011_GWF2_38_76]